MADNVTIPPTGTGDTTPVIAADDIAGVKHQRMKAEFGEDGTATDVSRTNPMPVTGLVDPVIASVDVTRPANTTTYTANDAIADTTPTAGGFTLASMANASGGYGMLNELIILSAADPALTLQGEIWIFNQAVTAVADNAAFAISDADLKFLMGVFPFQLVTTVAGSGTSSYDYLPNLSMLYNCVGSTSLRFLLKAKNAYIPVSSEVLTVIAKGHKLN